MGFSRDAEWIAAAMWACVANAEGLAASAKHLLSAGFHAPALSVGILALEEIGKVHYIDALALALAGDDRFKQFYQTRKSHGRKLQVLDFFPLMLQSLAGLDPRYATEERFRTALAISVKKYTNLRAALSQWLGDSCDLANLDHLKQSGFYVDATTRTAPRPPAVVVDRKLAEAVVDLAFQMTDAMKFFTGKDPDRYAERVRAWRTVDANDLATIREEAQRTAESLFSAPDIH